MIERLVKRLLTITLTLLFIGCAHPINIAPMSHSEKTKPTSTKKVGYVISGVDKARQITTAGGGGDKVTYYPYRDLEKAIREALASVYTEANALNSASDASGGVSLIFIPSISTVSKSESMLTWPPTHFYIDLSCDVLDTSGNLVESFKVSSDGYAEYSEFKQDPGLAGQRAATNLITKLRQAIISNDKLK